MMLKIKSVEFVHVPHALNKTAPKRMREVRPLCEVLKRHDRRDETVGAKLFGERADGGPIEEITQLWNGMKKGMTIQAGKRVRPNATAKDNKEAHPRSDFVHRDSGGQQLFLYHSITAGVNHGHLCAINKTHSFKLAAKRTSFVH